MRVKWNLQKFYKFNKNLIYFLFKNIKFDKSHVEFWMQLGKVLSGFMSWIYFTLSI